MKNYYFTILVLSVIFLQSSNAQWSGTGPVTTTDAVGIGTTTPQSLLHIKDGNQSIKFLTGTCTSGYTLSVGVNNNGINFSNNSNIRGFIFSNNAGRIMTLNANGNVGIGTTSNEAKLVIRTNGAHYSGTPTLLVRDYQTRGTIVLESELDQPTDFVFKNNGYMRVWLTSRASTEGHEFRIYTNPTGQGPELAMKIAQNGNAAFYGKLEAKEIRVKSSPSADFVFDSDYKLRSLEEVDVFVKENHHLPEIASAIEMEENGLNMAEFQIQLLQKIEELTLYLIDLNKENAEQQRLIDELINN